MPGLSAPEARGSGAQAQWSAAHRAINTGAVVPAVGLEGLAIGIAHAIQDAAHTDHLCKHRWWTWSGRAAWALPCSFPSAQDAMPRNHSCEEGGAVPHISWLHPKGKEWAM